MESKFFLNLELNETQVLPVPEKREENETVVGTCPAELQKLWSLWVGKEKTTKKMYFQMQMDEAMADEARVKELYRKKAEAEILEQVFWFEIRCAFELWNIGVGIRENYEVVSITKKGFTIIDLLGGFGR